MYRILEFLIPISATPNPLILVNSSLCPGFHYWHALDLCLHRHRAVVSSDLRLQAAHAAFQLQLATLCALHPSETTPSSPLDASPLRASLVSLLNHLAALISGRTPSQVCQSPQLPDSLPLPGTLHHAALLERAENSVRTLRDHPDLWSGLGLAALQVRTLADLRDAFALETGALLPVTTGDRSLEVRTHQATREIHRLICQELDPLVGAHSARRPSLVADYQAARHPAPGPDGATDPRTASLGFRSPTTDLKVSLSS